MTFDCVRSSISSSCAESSHNVWIVRHPWELFGSYKFAVYLLVCFSLPTLLYALRCNAHGVSAGGVLFREARVLGGLNFSHVAISFCSRTCNKLAHAMAAGASGILLCTVSGRCGRRVGPGSVSVQVPSDLTEHHAVSQCSMSKEKKIHLWPLKLSLRTLVTDV